MLLCHINDVKEEERVSPFNIKGRDDYPTLEYLLKNGHLYTVKPYSTNSRSDLLSLHETLPFQLFFLSSDLGTH